MKPMPMCEVCSRNHLSCKHSSIPRGPIVAFDLARQSMVNLCPTCFFSHLELYKQCHYNLVDMEANMPSEITVDTANKHDEIVKIILKDIEHGGTLYNAIKGIK